MPQMTNPYDTLVRFQAAIKDKLIEVQRGSLHPGLIVHYDQPATGAYRYTYALTERNAMGRPKVIAVAVYVSTEPVQGEPCFNMGYAVHENYRGKGLAKKVVSQSLDELRVGFKKFLPAFWIEAVVARINDASNAIASKLINTTPRIEALDHDSQVPSYVYQLRIA